MHKSSLSKNARGFTLIELLIVIAIIGILATIILMSLGGASAKGRDAARTEEVKSLETSLQSYFLTNGVYPPCVSQPDDYGCDVTELATALVPNYMGTIPSDPNFYLQYVRSSPTLRPQYGYGILVYSESTQTNCLAGVNLNPQWWGTQLACKF